MAGTGTAHLRDDEVVLSVRDLVVEYDTAGAGKVHAVSNVSLDIRRGETLAWSRIRLREVDTREGHHAATPADIRVVMFEGRDLTTLAPRELRSVRRPCR